MEPARIVELEFDYISAQRANRMKWAAIERQLKAKGYRLSRGYLRSLYQKEIAKRTSPERKLRVKWLYQNYEGISNLLASGLQWEMVLMLVPLAPETDNHPIDLPGFIADYELVAEALKSTDPDAALTPGTLSQRSDPIAEFVAKVESGQRTAEAPPDHANVHKPSTSEKIFGTWT